MKKIIIYVALAVLSAVSAKAQVSIGTLNDPKATLDVRKVTPTPATAPSGIIAPNISGADLKADDQKYGAPQTGAIVYATSASPDAGVTGAKTIKVAKAGYYYFDGTIWQSFGSAEDNWFYLPSFNLPITTTGTGFTFDLYNEYKTQFTKETGDTQFVSSNSSATLVRKIYAAAELDYYVTSYASTVIKINSISAAGVMNYDVLSLNIPEGSFINVIFVVK